MFARMAGKPAPLRVHRSEFECLVRCKSHRNLTVFVQEIMSLAGRIALKLRLHQLGPAFEVGEII